jgi:hypothetical protein
MITVLIITWLIIHPTQILICLCALLVESSLYVSRKHLLLCLLVPLYPIITIFIDKWREITAREELTNAQRDADRLRNALSKEKVGNYKRINHD